nr:MFS transporter [Methylobacterium frigidaeris]
MAMPSAACPFARSGRRHQSSSRLARRSTGATTGKTISAGDWPVLGYLTVFLMAAFGLGTQAAGVALLAATLPMLVLPPLGGHMVRHLGGRRSFGSALALVVLGDAILVGAALAGSSALTGALVGMAAVGAGAALAHPQLTGAVVALAPPEAAGMASALTMVARQAGFVLGVAALGALAPTIPGGTGYAAVFAFATAAGLIGVAASRVLPDGAARRR